jgi:hypothetical protein
MLRPHANGHILFSVKARALGLGGFVHNFSLAK